MKKLVSLIAAFVVCLGLATTAFAEVTHVASEQLDAMENTLYGTHQEDSMLARIQSLEDDLYGHEEDGQNIGSIINVGVLWTLLFTRPLVLR